MPDEPLTTRSIPQAVGLALAVLLLADPAPARQVPAARRLDAAKPTPPPPPDRFELDYEGARRYLLRDGDPEKEDAPYVLAVVGGGRLRFRDWDLTAQTILLWIDPSSLEQGVEGEEGVVSLPLPPHTPSPRPPPSEPAVAGEQSPDGPPPARLSGRVREIYAEGDVLVRQGSRQSIEAEKAYFDVVEDRALLVRATLRADLSRLPGREGSGGSGALPAVPVTLRAAEMRGVARGLFTAENASATTSPLAEPGYKVEMDRMVFEQLARDAGGRVTGYGNRFVLGDQPLLEVPYLTLRTGVENPLPLIGISGGVSSRFGLFLETRWGGAFREAGERVNRALGIDGDFRGSWFLDANLYTLRGPALGGGGDYSTRGTDGVGYRGHTEALFLTDFSGQDKSFQGRGRNNSGFRGHFMSLNRVFLPDDWLLDWEVNWVSDRGFLKEFKEELFDEHKEPETLAYLHKREDDAMVSALLRFRLNDWQSQTQYLPQVTYDVLGRGIGSLPTFGEALGMQGPVPLSWEHRSEAAVLSRRLGDRPRNNDAEGTAVRFDDIERVHAPFRVGDFGVDPFVENRVTLWLGDVRQNGGGGSFRDTVTLGFNAQANYWRVFPNVESETFNIHGIRHIVTPRLRYRWTFGSSLDPDDLVPYDRVERHGNLHVLVPGIESRYQTKRHTPTGPETVTFLEFEAQQGIVFQNDRGSNNNTLGILHLEGRWRPDMEAYLLRHSQMSFESDWNWGAGSLDRLKLEFRTEPGPDFYSRAALSFSQRGRVRPTLALEGIAPTPRKNRTALSTLTLEFGYQLSRTWEVVAREQLSFAGRGRGAGFGGGGETRFILRRSTADWVVELGVGSSGVGPGIGVSVSPRAAFRRQERQRFRTALSDGYDLLPVFEEPLWSQGRSLASPPPDESP